MYLYLHKRRIALLFLLAGRRPKQMPSRSRQYGGPHQHLGADQCDEIRQVFWQRQVTFRPVVCDNKCTLTHSVSPCVPFSLLVSVRHGYWQLTFAVLLVVCSFAPAHSTGCLFSCGSVLPALCSVAAGAWQQGSQQAKSAAAVWPYW